MRALEATALVKAVRWQAAMLLCGRAHQVFKVFASLSLSLSLMQNRLISAGRSSQPDKSSRRAKAACLARAEPANSDLICRLFNTNALARVSPLVPSDPPEVRGPTSIIGGSISLACKVHDKDSSYNSFYNNYNRHDDKPAPEDRAGDSLEHAMQRHVMELSGNAHWRQ